MLPQSTPSLFAPFRSIAISLLLGLVALSASAQRVNFEQLAEHGWEFSRSWVDVNNDGKDDHCMFVGNDAQTLQCYLSTGTEFQATPMTVAIGAWEKRRYWWIDLNGDGQVDLCRQMNATTPLLSADYVVQCRLGPAFGATAQITLPHYFITSCPFDTPCTPTTGAGVRDERDIFFSDVNLDGTQDLCYLHTANETSYELRCVPFVGTAFSSIPASGRALSSIGERDWPRGFYDVNGDGYPDFCRVGGGSLMCALGSSAGFVSGADFDSSSTTTGDVPDSVERLS